MHAVAWSCKAVGRAGPQSASSRPSSQNATAAAAATFSESTPRRIGITTRTSLAACAADAAPAATPAAEPTPHETLHVLVVDDNAANRFVAGKLLEMFGCSSEMAENGAEALAAVQARAFDLVLMDIKMPVMDGVSAARAIRGLPGPEARLPILALTANADERDEADYVAAGMNGVAQKPIQPDALLNAIRLVLAGVEATPAQQAA